METNDSYIKHNDRVYRIQKQKIKYILSCLEGRKITDTEDTELISLLKRYDLLDEVFLENINKM